MTVPDRITAAWLREQGACEEQVAIVAREWPDGARPLLATARKARRLGLDVGWLAARLLRDSELAAYRAVCAQARAAFEAVCDQALLAGWRAALARQKQEDE